VIPSARLIINQAGQAMTEYVIVVAVTVLVGFSSFPLVIKGLNGLYEGIVTIVSLPFP
jgi:hypothetical protein